MILFQVGRKSQRQPELNFLLKQRGLVWAVLALAVLFQTSAKADFLTLNGSEVAPNIAEIRISEDGVRVQLEIYVEDAKTFEALLPDSWFKEDAAQRPTETARLAEFASSGLSIRRADGTPLPVLALAVEQRIRIDRASPVAGQRNPLTGQIHPAPPQDKRVIYAELFYSFENHRPGTLILMPPSDPEGTPLATIGMVVFDREVPVINFRYLSGPARLTLNWSDPRYSRFDNANLTRQHKSGTTTYLYVEPREVRHETLIRVRDLDPWFGLGLETGEILDSEVQEAIKTRAVEFLAGRNPLRIDENAVQSETQRVEILRITTKGLEIVEPGTSVNGDIAFVGVILSFPVEETVAPIPRLNLHAPRRGQMP